MADAIYLGPERSGVAWLLDPSSPRLAALARELEDRLPETSCDPEAIAADLDMLPRLIRERHFGIATGMVPLATELDSLIAQARRRMLAARPEVWGDALGELNDDLRRLTRDRHISLRGSWPSTIRADEAVAKIDHDGPAVEVNEHHGVLCVTIRRFWGGPADDAALWAFAAAGEEHFQHQRIIVDLRGNIGGNDAVMWNWMSDALPDGAHFPVTSTGWYVGATPIGMWNVAALIEARAGRDAVPRYHLEHRHTPAPQDVLTVRRDDDEPTQPGTRPWHGAMLVLVDGATKSSGESAMWMLRHGLAARVAGQPTAGTLEFGNVVPYLLANSGLHVGLGSKHNDFGARIEMVGFPVDLELDPTTSIDRIAADFTDLHRSASV